MKKAERVVVLVGTHKGLWTLASDARRRTWSLDGPAFLGHNVYHAVLDPRDRKTVLAATRPGHLGPTVHRSMDGGRSWKEASRPPAFPKREGGESVKHVFWLTAGHPSRPGQWYAGTAPHGLFRSDDGGDTWDGVAGINEFPARAKWVDPANNPPDSPNTHSFQIDPRDPRHFYIGFSSGGVFESTDEGATWKPLNKGVENPYLQEPNADFGHDPHRVLMSPANLDRLYMQNHFGLYRLDRPGDAWTRIGRNMPKEVGDIGFPLVVDPRDADRAWVFPMDGSEVWPRTPPGGKPAAFMTKDGGKSWRRQNKGFPPRQAWWTVKRQAFATDGRKPLGLYVGTMAGEVWGSRAEGQRWECLARHLPAVYSIETGSPA